MPLELTTQNMGDGMTIRYMETPMELEESLSCAFTEDQATMIAADVYQALLDEIETLMNRVEELERRAE